MADLFNPYREWLGVETVGSAPPDHYQLLGLAPFEPDAARIGSAADAAMARVRRIRPGIHLADWSLLLDQLGEAKSCLLDKMSKAAYDAGLAKAFAPRPEDRVIQGDCPDFCVSKNGTVPFDVSAHPAPTVVQPAGVEVSSSLSWTGPVITGLLVMVLGMAGLLIQALYQRGALTAAPASPSASVAASPRPVEKAISSLAKSSDKKNAEQVIPPKDIVAVEPRTNAGLTLINLRSEGDGTAVDVQSEGTGNVVRVRREGAETVVSVRAANDEEDASETEAAKPDLQPAESNSEPEAPSRPIDPRKTSLFAKAADNARTAMAARDLAAAKRHLKTAVANAQTEQETEQTKRLETMLGYLDQFWTGIRAAMAKLQPLEEIAVADTRIVVVESDNDYLSIKAEGRVHRFKATTLPAVLIGIIVQQQFAKDAGSKAIIGTFMAVDPEGDRALARRYWQEAGRAGFDAESLTPELDSPAFAKKNSKTNKATNRQRSRYPNRAKPPS